MLSLIAARRSVLLCHLSTPPLQATRSPLLGGRFDLQLVVMSQMRGIQLPKTEHAISRWHSGRIDNHFCSLFEKNARFPGSHRFLITFIARVPGDVTFICLDRPKYKTKLSARAWIPKKLPERKVVP